MVTENAEIVAMGVECADWWVVADLLGHVFEVVHDEFVCFSEHRIECLFGSSFDVVIHGDSVDCAKSQSLGRVISVICCFLQNILLL